MISLWWEFLKADVAHLVEYKKSALSEFAFYLVETGVWLVFWQTISFHFPKLGNWSQSDLIILVGVTGIYLGTWASFFIFPAIMPYLILDGTTFEKYMTKPVPLFPTLVGERFQLRRVSQQLLVGLIIVIGGFFVKNEIPSIINIGMAVLLMLLGICALSIFQGSLNCLAFWIPQWSFGFFTDPMIDLSRFPLDRLRSHAKIFLMMGIPIMFLATIPTQALLGRIVWEDFFLYCIMMLVFIGFWSIIFHNLWQRGLQRFSSGGG
ncbi:MAG: ABC-2 family transporter protein [Candidatus Hodarchaeota archaeon]